MAISFDDLFALAVQHHQAGALVEAEGLYREALRLHPREPACYSNLGELLRAQGRLFEAAAALARAIELNPDFASAHYNLGQVRQALGNSREAISSFREAVRCQPEFAEAHNNLGSLLTFVGELEQARNSFHAALRARPNYARAHANLAHVLQLTGDLDAALDHGLQATALDPNLLDAQLTLGLVYLVRQQPAEAALCFQRVLASEVRSVPAHFHLANAQRLLGDDADAESHFLQTLVLQPDHYEAYNNLGNLYKDRGDLTGAIAAYRQALSLAPNQSTIHNNLGVALLEAGLAEESLPYQRQAIELTPGDAVLVTNLGNVFKELGDLDAAAVTYRQALELDPNSRKAHNNLAVVYQRLGLFADAEREFRAAVALDPDDANVGSNLLLHLNYSPDLTPEQLFAEHQRWGHSVESACTPQVREHRPQTGGRALRVGYVSADFRHHPVAAFIESLLVHHDRAAVELYIYSDVTLADAVTQGLRALVPNWRDTAACDDAQFAELVRADRLNILVDLAGHTARNRLPAFARRLAPVQVTWLGYPNTTGLQAIDYRLTDSVVDPPGVLELATERLWRLPHGFCCYAPPIAAPDVSPLPARSTGTITFGSPHGLPKLNWRVLDLWARVLLAVPNSCLRLVRDTLTTSARRRLTDEFERRGIDAQRLQMVSNVPTGNHLAIYRDFDVVLDAFPWSSHTTACEALWMGVPVVTFAGAHHASRMAASVLIAIGAPEWVAASEDDYLARAVTLVKDLDALAATRARLRSQMSASPLCDGPALARDIEAAFRAMC